MPNIEDPGFKVPPNYLRREINKGHTLNFDDTEQDL